MLLAAQTVKNEKGSLRLALRAPGDTTDADRIRPSSVRSHSMASSAMSTRRWCRPMS